jgi:Spy/CpxP family protein refolding chaperone
VSSFFALLSLVLMPHYRFLLAIALAPALASPLPTRAQKAPTRPAQASAPSASVQARADALTTNMAQALSLTPAQIEKVRAINLTAVRNVETARQLYKEEPAKLKGYVEDVGLARLDRLKEVLTPVQFTRYQQKREEKMGIPTLRGGQGNPPPGLPGGRGEE